MTPWAKIVAGVIAAAAVALLAYAVLTPEPQTDGTDHMGTWNGHMTYSSTNVSLIAVSVVIIVASLMVMVLWHAYEPLPPSMTPPPPVRAHLASEAAPDNGPRADAGRVQTLAATETGLKPKADALAAPAVAAADDKAAEGAAHN